MSGVFSKILSGLAVLFLAASAVNAEDIKRNGEGKFFYRSIEVPPGAETLYVSGHVPPVVNKDAAKGSVDMFGNTQTQTENTFASIERTLEAAGWSMGDVVMVRVYLVADPKLGKMDFGGFNKGFMKYFGNEQQPNKPVRAVVEVADLVRKGWLVEIEVRAARMPK